MTQQLTHTMKDGIQNAIAIKEKEVTLKNDTPFNYEKNHIFQAVLNYSISKAENINEVSSLTYFFYLYENLLQESQMKNFHISSLLVEKIKKLHENNSYKSEILQSGRESLFNPAIGYYYYSTKDYRNAEAHMNKALEDIDVLLHDGLRDAIFMKIEQYLNSFRVQQSSGDVDKSLFYATEVLSFLLNQSNNTSFDGKCFSDYQQSEAQAVEINNMFFDAIIFKTLYSNPTTNSIYDNEYLKSLFTNINNREYAVRQEIHDIVNVVSLILEKKYEVASSLVPNLNLFNEEIPISLRSIVFSFTVNELIYDEIDHGLRDEIIKYQTDILKLKDNFIFKIQDIAS